MRKLLFGTLAYIKQERRILHKCYACHRPTELSKEETEKEVGVPIEPPRCQRCNGRMRPAVVWYGEDLSSLAWREALRLVKECWSLYAHQDKQCQQRVCFKSP
ncbi:Sir2 family NAD-dependent protein deacetylase [Pseudomonas cichorii]|uniref:Sir2 family NAD-dependent protein deacetylase n=1 Tax=Pseudomonas cichorii TaxID=36746 RepID=UPI001C8A0C80|nr:hypothetical protein [Pseudomonas cichorii]